MNKIILLILLSTSVFSQDIPIEFDPIFGNDPVYPRSIPVGNDRAVLLHHSQFEASLDSMTFWRGGYYHYKSLYTTADSLLSLKEMEDGLMIGAVSSQQSTIEVLSNTNKRVSDKSLELYGKNTDSIFELRKQFETDMNHSKDLLRREEDSKKQWRKTAVTVGIVAIVEAVLIGILTGN